MEPAMPTVVLVHGAWSGPWVWDEVRRYLDLAGITSATIALSSVGGNLGKLGGLADDIAAISAAMDELSGPFVLVGHSYGGVPVTEVAAAREDITHVIYVSAFAVPVGASLVDAAAGVATDWWIIDEDGDSVLPDNPGALLFSECAPAVASDAIARLRPHSLRSVREPLRAARYGEIPATYVISERDAILPADVQKGIAGLAQAATASVDSDHHPMLSRPAELALILSGILAHTALAEPARPDREPQS